MILHQADCSMLSIILSLVHPYKIQSLPAVRRNVRHADKIIAQRMRNKCHFSRCQSRKKSFSTVLFCSETKRKRLLRYPGFQRIFFSYRFWWFAAKPPWRGAKRRGEKNYYYNYFFLLGALHLVNAASPRTIRIDKKNISSLTQGIATQANKITNKIYVWFR